MAGEELGKQIKLARISAQLTQQQLAERVYISQDTVSRYERGIVVPDILRLLAIGRALEKPLDYFVC